MAVDPGFVAPSSCSGAGREPEPTTQASAPLCAPSACARGIVPGLGTIKNPTAIPALVARLRDPDMGVRWKARGALQGFDAAATTAPYLTDMMKAFIANGSLDQYPIDWADPLRQANTCLSALLFQQRPDDTLTAPKDLPYEAVKVGLAQPDGYGRANFANFIQNNLTWEHVQTLAPNIVEAAKEPPPADRMLGWDFPIHAIKTLARYNVAKGNPLAVRIADKYHLYGGLGNSSGEALKVLSNTYRGSAKDASRAPTDAIMGAGKPGDEGFPQGYH